MTLRFSATRGLTLVFLLSLVGCGVPGAATISPPSPAVSAATISPSRHLFDLIDGDGNGYLTYEEVVQAPWGEPDGGYAPGQKEARSYRFIIEHDRNGDARLTYTEAKLALTAIAPDESGQSRRVFDAIDTNEDQRLSYQEVFDAPWSAPQGGYAPGQKEARAYQFIQRHDRNDDGFLTFDEARDAL